MSIYNVPAEDWDEFCRDFSARHAGEAVTIELVSEPSSEPHVIARDCPLHSLHLERSGGETLLVFLERHSADGGPHFVVPLARLRLEQADTEPAGRVRIDTADGQVILLHFPVSVLPGLLDGV